MEKSAGSSRLVAGVLGAACLLSLLLVNLATSATVGGVSLFGHQTHFGCWVKEKFSVPCPVCGMTRGLVLTLHGNLGAAFQMHIGAPLFVFGLLFFGTAMVYAALPANVNRKVSSNIEQKIFIATAVYLGIVTLVSLVYWLLRLAGYFNTLPELQ